MRIKFVTIVIGLLLAVALSYDIIGKFIYTFFTRETMPSALWRLESDPPFIPSGPPDYWLPVLMLLATAGISLEMGTIGVFLLARYTALPSKLYNDTFLMNAFLTAGYIVTIICFKESLPSKLPYTCINLLGKHYSWKQHLVVHFGLLTLSVTGYFIHRKIPKSYSVVVSTRKYKYTRHFAGHHEIENDKNNMR